MIFHFCCRTSRLWTLCRSRTLSAETSIWLPGQGDPPAGDDHLAGHGGWDDHGDHNVYGDHAVHGGYPSGGGGDDEENQWYVGWNGARKSRTSHNPILSWRHSLSDQEAEVATLLYISISYCECHTFQLNWIEFQRWCLHSGNITHIDWLLLQLREGQSQEDRSPFS